MNFLTIFTDQQTKFAMRCAGTADIHTPNLDRLAAEGVLFRRAYTNNPICGPFRISLMTGKYSSETNSMGNNKRVPADCLTLPDQLNEAGYVSSFVGKWHVGGKGSNPVPEELRAGYSRFIGYQCYNSYYDEVCFYDEEHREHRFEQHRTDVTGALGLERLRGIQDRPFFHTVFFQAPHYPEQPAPEYYERYRGTSLRKRPNFTGQAEPFTETRCPPSAQPKEQDPDYRKYGGDWDEYLRNYYAMVSQIDAQVGRLLDFLDENGLRDKTTVLFASDHGDMQGSHGLVNKCQPYEESAGIPFIVSVPGGRQGAVCDIPVSAIDIYPTVLQLAGIENQAEVSGKDFSSMLFSDQPEPERSAISEQMAWQMIVRGAKKLSIKRQTSEPELFFDLDDDPYEMSNLVDDPAHADEIEELRNVTLTTLPAWGRSDPLRTHP